MKIVDISQFYPNNSIEIIQNISQPIDYSGITSELQINAFCLE
jgi:hypothetical protein